MKDFSIMYDAAIAMEPKLWPMFRFLGTPMRLVNPAIDFTNDVRNGYYNCMSDEDYDYILKIINSMSSFWHGKKYASLFVIAMHFVACRGLLDNDDEFQSLLDLYKTYVDTRSILKHETHDEEDADEFLCDEDVLCDEEE